MGWIQCGMCGGTGQYPGPYACVHCGGKGGWEEGGTMTDMPEGLTEQERYERDTGEPATYRKESSDFHTLRYVRWLERQLAEAKAEVARLKGLLERACLGCRGGSVHHTCGKKPDADATLKPAESGEEKTHG